MEKEKDAVLDFLNGTEEKSEVFKEETTEEPVVETEEKVLPFHKDPKVQRYVERQIEKALKDIKPSAEQTFRKEANDINLPPSFVKLVGNDTAEKVEVLKDLSTYFGTLKGEARQEFLQEMKEQEQKAKAQDDAAVEELNSGLEQINEDYGIDLDSDAKTRASFIEFLRKVSPKNEDGEVREFADIPSTWETFQEMNKKVSQPSRAKELASRGITRSNDASGPAPTGRSWKDVDRYFDSLTKK